MSAWRAFLHDNKLILAILILLASVSVMVMAIIGIPDEDGNEGIGPLASLMGLNILFLFITFVTAVVSGYIIYKFVSDKNKFEALINSNSQAIFKRNQIEIERLALRLTTKEERRVIEMMKKYKIK
ncbi:MAG: DUF3198 domain-containing protein [Thermoplasmata archaeon]|nr:DUF3198 domain-containing protein [Thermoplasmata archaeon]